MTTIEMPPTFRNNTELVGSALRGHAAQIEVLADRVENLGMAEPHVVNEMLSISRRLEELSRIEFDEP